MVQSVDRKPAVGSAPKQIGIERQYQDSGNLEQEQYAKTDDASGNIHLWARDDQKSIGTMRHLFRVLLLLEVPSS